MLGGNTIRFDNYTTKLNVHYQISLSFSISLSAHTYIHKPNVVSFCLYYNSSHSSFTLHVFIDVRAACYMLLHGTRT